MERTGSRQMIFQPDLLKGWEEIKFPAFYAYLFVKWLLYQKCFHFAAAISDFQIVMADNDRRWNCINRENEHGKKHF